MLSRARASRHVRIGIVSSCGGHLTEVRALRPIYEQYEHFYVINDRIGLPPDMVGRTHFIAHAERNLLVAYNFAEAMRILVRERPDVLLSAGAGPIVPFALVGKLLGIRTIFIETFAAVRSPSWSGRIMYRLADRFFYQWPELERFYPGGVFGGALV